MVSVLNLISWKSNLYRQFLYVEQIKSYLNLENISESFGMLFLIANLSFLGHWTQRKKTTALYKAPFLKKSRKLPEIGHF